MCDLLARIRMASEDGKDTDWDGHVVDALHMLSDGCLTLAAEILERAANGGAPILPLQEPMPRERRRRR